MIHIDDREPNFLVDSGKENESMSSRTIRYSAGEIGRVRVIDDFLPAPADLVPREENVKVTLSLSRRSLDFFKREAKKRRVPYQRMIRALVDTYAERQVGGKRS
jgi:predicted DNA binding CopG/RHH family protein